MSRIVICGAGQVGTSIAGHLVQNSNGKKRSNTVTIIDADAEKVQQATDSHDLRGVIGVSSHPDVLERAGAKEAEMIIAVTDSDEVNMVACQVAYVIFNIETNIARIRAGSYLDKQFGDLFSSGNLPITHTISPEAEVSKAALRRLKVPGAFDMHEMSGGKVYVVGVRCTSLCHILDTPIRYLTALFTDLKITIVAIIRSNQVIVPRDGSDTMMEGDQVYFIKRVCK